jgi:hypothetical protein
MARSDPDEPLAGQVECAIGSDLYPPACWLMCDGQIGLCAGLPAAKAGVFFEIAYGDGTVRVKNAYAELGRFSMDSIVVYRSIADRLAGFPNYLFALHRAVTKADWAWFGETMLRHHGIDLSASPPPGWLAFAAG